MSDKSKNAMASKYLEINRQSSTSELINNCLQNNDCKPIKPKTFRLEKSSVFDKIHKFKENVKRLEESEKNDKAGEPRNINIEDLSNEEEYISLEVIIPEGFKDIEDSSDVSDSDEDTVNQKSSSKLIEEISSKNIEDDS